MSNNNIKLVPFTDKELEDIQLLLVDKMITLNDKNTNEAQGTGPDFTAISRVSDKIQRYSTKRKVIFS